ncbi:uridine kinase [Catalinimonas alkaloidigena]|uniref:uridine/cytidine kinase n=1 Tax=Catalinimonas alkaloidigena TaxID=1075417 RepID=A0A1G9DQ16_9BACT|nr:uridine kinase [Catalinimonas alkaloidigena]SDK65939.1 uridine kinase [Catalinimonas alkaloidigena]
MAYQPYIVGITGGSASGKTRLLRRLLDVFPKEDMCLISQDNYYRPQEEQPLDINGVINYDMPESIDHEAYSRDIAALRRGETVTRPEYTFNNPELVPSVLTYHPAPLILVEGIFVFYYPDVSRLIDLKVFVDAREHVKLKRRIMRDLEERGYGLEDILYQYEHHVVPTYEQYIKPFKYDADLILPNNDTFDKGLDVVISYLKQKIQATHDQ